MIKPVVCSVVCVTYNHLKYIEQAINSVLAQDTSYRFEIIVHDDCSTDGSSDIIDKIVLENSDVVRLVRPHSNRFSKDRFSFFSDVIKLCRGKYIALLDGDDFWIDPSKLEDDINYLENYTDVSMLFSAAEQLNEDTGARKIRNKYPDRTEFTLEYIIKTGGGFFPTSTSIFRSEVFKCEPDWFHSHTTLDYPIAILAALKGKVQYRGKTTGIYLSHSRSFSHIVEEDVSAYVNKVKKNFEINESFYKRLKASNVISVDLFSRMILKETYILGVKLYSCGAMSFFQAINEVEGVYFKGRFFIRFISKQIKL